MRILEVVAHAFGPFRDRRFQFAPGFTLVHGANEAGKTSLHAAAYVGLCGVRRGKGRQAAELEFERRYRPWEGSGWKVSLTLELEDGLRVEMIQDLDDKAQCKALDALRGRDLTSRIENEGTPDGAKFLGLDRHSFLATACVRQTQLLAVRDDPAVLQEHLQRGIDTSGSDATAAEALERIDTFLKEQIGARTANSTKPLRRSIVRLAEANQALERARSEHGEYLMLLAREDELVQMLERAQRDLGATRASLTLTEAGARRQVVERARELARRHVTGPPAGLVEGEERTGEVERVLHAFEMRPAALLLEGRDAAELRRELEALEAAIATHATRSHDGTREPLPDRDSGGPEHSRIGPPGVERTRFEASGRGAGGEGAAIATSAAQRATTRPTATRLLELQPAAEVLEAVAQVRALRGQIDEHRAERPPDPGAAPGSGASAAQLRALATALTQPEPAADRRLETQRRQLELQLLRARRVGRRLLVGAVACALVGAPLAITGALGHGSLVAGIALLAIAAGLAVVSLRQAGSAGRVAAHETLRELESLLSTLRVHHDDWLAAREDAMRLARRRDLVPDPRILNEQAAAREQWERQVDKQSTWDEALARLVRQDEKRSEELRRLLAARGAATSHDALADAEAYRKACAARAQRRDLEVRLAERERDEAARDRAEAQRRASEADLLRVAQACGIPSEDVDVCRAGLETWRATRRLRLAAQDQARQEWNELERLLDGRTLAAVEAELAAAEAHAEELAARFSPQEIQQAGCDEAARTRHGARVREADLALARLRGEIAQHGVSAPRVSEAEEELAAATRENERLSKLEATLQSTREFLQRAQERVHRNVAPRLAAAILPQLPRVTAGRYDEVRVDPESFDVHVRGGGGPWRQAALLSHGTAEQIYLLLRVAMAGQLVQRGEVCPLLLDDVAVHFDRERKQAVLEILHTVSAERQVILLTQEEDVLEWARAHLSGPRDAVLELDPHF